MSPSNPAGWKALAAQPIDVDGPIQWRCSAKGWNCCTDKVIPVRPYDLVRLRHATGKPAQQILSDDLVTFVWDSNTGAMWGFLAQVPYERTRKACVFFDEITNVNAREIRENDPERFALLPENVRRAADSTAAGEWRVAGLCRAHLNRPQACREFPFQRDPAREARENESPVIQVSRCGTCALSGLTTPREILADNALDDFWRADDAFLEVTRYLRSRGAAQITDPTYRALPISAAERAGLWVAMYLSDANAAIAERFPDQWRLPHDPAGDEAIYRLLMEQALDSVDALVAQHGLSPADLGPTDARPRPRPDLAPLFDPRRELLMPVLRAQAS